MREGLQDDREDELIEGAELWGPVQTQPNLYKATATLRRRPSNQEKHQREAGIICRVQHCSLQEPIERLWRNVGIGVNHSWVSVHYKHLLYIILLYWHLSFYFSTAAPFIPSSISVCWSSEGVGVFSLLLKAGHPKAKLFWAAGGTTLSPLVSSETEDIGDNGLRELKSVCALERSTGPLSLTEKEKKKNGHAISNFHYYNYISIFYQYKWFGIIWCRSTKA